MPTIAPVSDDGGGRPASDVSDGLRPAGLLRRLAAMIYDGFIVVAVLALSLFPFVMATNDFVQGPWVRALLFLELYAFFAYFWISRGQTVGMLAWRLQILSNDGGPLTLGQATWRFVGAMAGLLCLGLGYLWILFDPARRSWSDLLSSSQVLYQPKPAP